MPWTEDITSVTLNMEGACFVLHSCHHMLAPSYWDSRRTWVILRCSAAGSALQAHGKSAKTWRIYVPSLFYYTTNYLNLIFRSLTNETSCWVNGDRHGAIHQWLLFSSQICAQNISMEATCKTNWQAISLYKLIWATIQLHGIFCPLNRLQRSSQIACLKLCDRPKRPSMFFELADINA